MTIRFIGDVHGKYSQYKKLIKDIPVSIQVGDMGVGFYKLHGGERKAMSNPPFDSMAEGNHRFIRGNHDNPGVCKNHKFWIPDGHYDHKNKIFFCGGALSIDKTYRTHGFDYWDDEELTHQELRHMIERYSTIKPDIMVTHDCPDSFANEILMSYRMEKQRHPSITRQAFEIMFHNHKPKLWVFGHWHESIKIERSGTVFRCLSELEYEDIDLKDYV